MQLWCFKIEFYCLNCTTSQSYEHWETFEFLHFKAHELTEMNPLSEWIFDRWGHVMSAWKNGQKYSISICYFIIMFILMSIYCVLCPSFEYFAKSVAFQKILLLAFLSVSDKAWQIQLCSKSNLSISHNICASYPNK